MLQLLYHLIVDIFIQYFLWRFSYSVINTVNKVFMVRFFHLNKSASLVKTFNNFLNRIEFAFLLFILEFSMAAPNKTICGVLNWKLCAPQLPTTCPTTTCLHITTPHPMDPRLDYPVATVGTRFGLFQKTQEWSQ